MVVTALALEYQKGRKAVRKEEPLCDGQRALQYNNLVIEGFLVLFNMVAPHGEKPYFVVAESSVRNFVKYLVLQRSDLACLQILLYHAGRKSRHGPEVQEAVCRGDRPHGARGPEVRRRGPGVQSGAQGGVRPLRGAEACTGVHCTVTGSCSP